MKLFTWLLATVALAFSTATAADELFIRGATVHTLSEAGVLENSDILVRDGTIAAIGQGLSAPAGAEVIDAAGRPVTPALFAGISVIGLSEVELEASSVDSAIEGLAAPYMRPEFNVVPAYNPNSSLVPITRVEGFGFTLLGATAGDSIIAGQGRMVRLDGGYRSFVGDEVLFVVLGSSGSELAGGSRAAQWMQLEQALAEAERAPRDGEPMLLTRQGRETLKRFTRGGTVVFKVNRASDILQTIDFAQRHGFKAVIDGGAEAWMVAEELAAADVPVLLDPLVNLPGSFDSLGARLDNAALLYAAGVDIAFSGAESHNARKTRQLAGNAVANGLPWEAGLAALTASPSAIFGVDNGRLREGAKADLVLWSGDPLEVTTAADAVIMGGRLDDMTSRQTRLRDRYLPESPAMPRAYIKP